MKITDIIKNIFTSRNSGEHKEIILAGIKFKFRNKNLVMKHKLDNLNMLVNQLLDRCNNTCFETNNEKLVNKLLQVNNINTPFLYKSDKNRKPFFETVRGYFQADMYINLIKNLDYKSVETVNSILGRVNTVLNSPEGMIDLFTNNEMNKILANKKLLKINTLKLNENCFAYNKYLLPINYFDIHIFIDRYYIDTLNKDYFKDKDIIDAGGFVGDSAVIFSEYTNKCVYSFEPIKVNYENTLKTIELNKKKNIKAINLGLLEKDCEVEFDIYGAASSALFSRDNSKEVCKMTSLDKYVEENNLKVGLIKTDLEGSEQQFLKGAEKTIKTQRPTLLISIYHTASDFFTIKPLIESWDLNYNFRIVKPLDGEIMLETLLICEPAELECSGGGGTVVLVMSLSIKNSDAKKVKELDFMQKIAA